MPDFVVPLGFFLLVLALILYKKKRKKKGGTSSGGPRNQQMLKVSNNWGSLTSFLKGEDLGFLSRTPDGVMLSTADRDGQSGKTHFYKFNGPIQNKNVTEIWSKPGKQTGVFIPCLTLVAVHSFSAQKLPVITSLAVFAGPMMATTR